MVISEFNSKIVEQITELCGTSVVVLPAFRPDLKNKIESLFHSIDMLLAANLNGSGYIDQSYIERGTPSYVKQSKFNIKEIEVLIVRCILYLNKHLQQDYPFSPKMLKEMIQTNLQPNALDIFEYGVKTFNVQMKYVSQDLLYKTFLPRKECKYCRKGVKFSGKPPLYYVNFDKYYLNKMLVGKESGIFAYDPENMNCIWLLENGNYIQFDLVQSRYKDLDLYTIEELKEVQAEWTKAYKKTDLECKLKLIEQLEEAVDVKLPVSKKKGGKKS